MPDEKINNKIPSVLKKLAAITAAFALSLPFVVFLPLYFKRVMTRSHTSSGEFLDFNLHIGSFYRIYWDDYVFTSREGDFYFWLAINLCLACVYALAIVFAVRLILMKIFSPKK